MLPFIAVVSEPSSFKPLPLSNIRLFYSDGGILCVLELYQIGTCELQDLHKIGKKLSDPDGHKSYLWTEKNVAPSFQIFVGDSESPDSHISWLIRWSTILHAMQNVVAAAAR